MSHNHGNHSHSTGDGHCRCCHKEENHMKTKAVRIAAGLILFIAGFFTSGKAQIALYLASYVIAGFDIIADAAKNIVKGELFDENFLMSAASLGAIFIKKFAEAPAVILFYQIGEFLQDYAFERSEKSIKKITDIRPDYAYIKKDGGKIKVNAADVNPGDIIVSVPGERIPLDGIVINGESYVDTSCITGESVKRHMSLGNEVLSGYINSDSVIEIRVTRPLSRSAASRIIDLMKNSLEKKSRSEKFITKFAKIYTPIVVLAAVLTAVIPPLFDNFLFAKWIYKALTFLVISCPCALVISIPLGFFAGLGAASRRGIIVKGSNAIEQLAKADTVIFDKTGTLTKGIFEVSHINSLLDGEAFIKLCAYAEYYSNHPVAIAVKNKFGKKIDPSIISEYIEIAGKGVSVKLSGEDTLIGNKKLMSDFNIDIPDITEEIGTVLYAAHSGKYVGYAVISDEIRDNEIINKLKKCSIKTVMLTGDRKSAAENIGKQLGISEINSELLPEDKVRIVEEYTKNSICAFVGDGINDAPSLATANIGIAMGGIGSDAAIEAADVILINDDLKKIPAILKISKRTMKIVKENIVFSIGIKVIIMLLSFIGFSSMWLAVFADVGVALIAILNSMRALKIK